MDALRLQLLAAYYSVSRKRLRCDLVSYANSVHISEMSTTTLWFLLSVHWSRGDAGSRYIATWLFDAWRVCRKTNDSDINLRQLLNLTSWFSMNKDVTPFSK